ncbi:MAG TPA: hypothetical protein DCE41_02560, partial [Cytophagales bacterium]|nr:hypothetical protein [Cytophagales bacterium]
ASAHAAVDMGGISSDLPTEELDEFMVDVFLLGLYFLSLITILGLGNLFRWIGVFKRESSRTVSYLILSQYNILFFWVCSCLLFIMILPPQYGKTIWTEVILGISILLPFPITVFHFWRYRKYFSYNPLRGVMAWGVSWLTLTFLVSGLFDLCVVRLFLHMDGVGVAS